jgi:NAD+ diphosphatase
MNLIPEMNAYYWLALQDKWVIDPQAAEKLPLRGAVLGTQLVKTHQQLFGKWRGQPCYLVELAEDSVLPEGLETKGLRALTYSLSEEIFALTGRAAQLLFWEKTHQFCSRCGTAVELHPQERAKHCPNCQMIFYPKITPAMIVLVQRGDQILLSRSPHFAQGLYSVQAGFVEAGESVEETVVREIREEVGLEVKNVRYFGSQAWPFPSSLMLGFTAEYAWGELRPHPVEIEDARWCGFEDLPAVLPSKLSIASRLIKSFVDQQKALKFQAMP